MAETILEPRSKGGMRRRGHLLKGLRTLANDPKATPKQRLEACKMLFTLETAPHPNTEKSAPSPLLSEQDPQVRALLDRLREDDVA